MKGAVHLSVCLLHLFQSFFHCTVVLPIYRGCVYHGIGYIAVACWTPFFGAHELDIFHEIAVTLGPNSRQTIFREICSPRYSLCSRSRETIFREINSGLDSGLPVNAGWNTCCAMARGARWTIDTCIVLQGRVQLIHYQCKSWLQIANLGINNAF